MTQPYDSGYIPPYAGVLVDSRDNDHLNVLAICHYVLGGMMGLFGLFPIFHIFMGVMFMTRSIPLSSSPGATTSGASVEPPVEMIGLIFVIVGSVLVLFFETCALLTLLAGRSIAKRRRYVLVMISAGLNCMFMPIGTVLGVFTFVVMLRPSVRSQFPR